MQNRTEHHKKALLEALEKSLGIVTVACKQIGVGRTTFYEYYNNDPEFKKEVDGLKDVALDFAESKLHSRIKDGSDTAIIFYLKCQGKHRGYIEKQEIDTNVNLIGAIIDWSESNTSYGETD